MSERSDKMDVARRSLPPELTPVFEEFVADYKFCATRRHGAPYVSYIVLADMVRAGWRRVAETRAAGQGDEREQGSKS